MHYRSGTDRRRGRRGRVLVAALSAGLALSAGRFARAQPAAVAPETAVPRIRLGGSVGLGAGSFGLAGAASARAGVQITSAWATSLQITRAGSSDFWSTRKDAWTSYAFLVEFTVPGRLLTLGAGPAFAMGTLKQGCFSILTECSPPTSYDDYRGLGFDGRVAYTFGVDRPTYRGGFTLELGVHAGPRSLLLDVGIGVDLF